MPYEEIAPKTTRRESLSSSVMPGDHKKAVELINSKKESDFNFTFPTPERKGSLFQRLMRKQPAVADAIPAYTLKLCAVSGRFTRDSNGEPKFEPHTQTPKDFVELDHRVEGGSNRSEAARHLAISEKLTRKLAGEVMDKRAHHDVTIVRFNLQQKHGERYPQFPTTGWLNIESPELANNEAQLTNFLRERLPEPMRQAFDDQKLKIRYFRDHALPEYDEQNRQRYMRSQNFDPGNSTQRLVAVLSSWEEDPRHFAPETRKLTPEMLPDQKPLSPKELEKLCRNWNY